MKDKLRLNRENKILGGVLAGLAEYTGYNLIFLRICFVLAHFGGLIIIAILWIIYLILYFALRNKTDYIQIDQDKEEPLDIFDL